MSWHAIPEDMQVGRYDYPCLRSWRRISIIIFAIFPFSISSQFGLFSHLHLELNQVMGCTHHDKRTWASLSVSPGLRRPLLSGWRRVKNRIMTRSMIVVILMLMILLRGKHRKEDESRGGFCQREKGRRREKSTKNELLFTGLTPRDVHDSWLVILDFPDPLLWSESLSSHHHFCYTHLCSSVKERRLPSSDLMRKKRREPKRKDDWRTCISWLHGIINSG